MGVGKAVPATLLAIIVIWALSNPVDAADKKRFGVIPEGEVVVQLESFGAPVIQPGKIIPQTLAITVFLEVEKHDHVFAVCRKSHKVRDAMLQALYKKPIPRNSRGQMVLDEVGRTLTRASNRVLRRKLVKDAHVVPGMRSMGGGAVAKLPFHSYLGCGQVLKKGG